MFGYLLLEKSENGFYDRSYVRQEKYDKSEIRVPRKLRISFIFHAIVEKSDNGFDDRPYIR